jgi:hypothetical protein
MKVGDLVKVYWYSKESIGIVVSVHRKTVAVMAERGGQVTVEKYDTRHVLRIQNESR